MLTEVNCLVIFQTNAYNFNLILIFLFCHTTKIMKTVKEKIETMDLTMARRPKGNYEAYIN